MEPSNLCAWPGGRGAPQQSGGKAGCAQDLPCWEEGMLEQPHTGRGAQRPLSMHWRWALANGRMMAPRCHFLIPGTRGCASHGKGSWGGGLSWSALVGTVSSQESLKGKAEEGDFGVRAGATCPEPWLE